MVKLSATDTKIGVRVSCTPNLNKVKFLILRFVKSNINWFGGAPPTKLLL